MEWLLCLYKKGSASSPELQESKAAGGGGEGMGFFLTKLHGKFLFTLVRTAQHY